jgi:hypothetical protein
MNSNSIRGTFFGSVWSIGTSLWTYFSLFCEVNALVEHGSDFMTTVILLDELGQ